MAENVQGMASLRARLDATTSKAGRRKLMGQLGLGVVAEAKRLVPRKTGNLGRSIRLDGATEDSVRVVAKASYAVAVEMGTRAHEIRPRNRRALRWAASPSGRRLSGSPRRGAAVRFARRVQHPGTRAQPYMRPGAKRALEKAGLRDWVISLWNEAA